MVVSEDFSPKTSDSDRAPLGFLAPSAVTRRSSPASIVFALAGLLFAVKTTTNTILTLAKQLANSLATLKLARRRRTTTLFRRRNRKTPLRFRKNRQSYAENLHRSRKNHYTPLAITTNIIRKSVYPDIHSQKLLPHTAFSFVDMLQPRQNPQHRASRVRTPLESLRFPHIYLLVQTPPRAHSPILVRPVRSCTTQRRQHRNNNTLSA